jgi:hypothetical protein
MTQRTIHRRRRALPKLALFFVSVTALLGLSVGQGCSVLYATTSSEESLLCGPDDGRPRCLEGYACIRAADDQERCVRAGFKETGEPCLASAECTDGGVCADAYAELCPDGSTDLNCARVNDAVGGLRCRAPCDEATGFSCDGDDRCFFFEGLVPFCQQGTCASDTDCEGDTPALCVGERGGGRNGVCIIACDPLACFDGTCPCAEGQSCAMPADELSVSTRNVCDGAGVIPAGAGCDVQNPCVAGSTCVFRTDGAAFCAQWCRVGGGAPACDAGICQSVQQGSALGICQ